MSRPLYLLLAFLACFPTRLVLALENCPDLAGEQAAPRVTLLRQEIRHHDELYYKTLHPEISDAQYDALLDELLRLEHCFPALAAHHSPSSAPGSDLRPGAPLLRHERPMLSLSSSTGPKAVETLWARAAAATGVSPRMLVQPKVDGLPVELTYRSGRLISAATRGDGISGEDVTPQLRGIPGIPQSLSGSYPERVAVRGEIYADRELMAAASGAEPYATPRNFAAATLRSSSLASPALAALRLFPFELVEAGEAIGAASDLAALARLSEWGFPVRPELTWQAESLDRIRDLYRRILTDRPRYPFAADGIVVKLDDLELRRQLGEGARAPLWAAAWKFPPASATTVVRAIRWQVGRTGRRTPVAELDPVRLGGIRINHVSLQNAQTLARLGAVPGATVVVALVGDVIPQVQEVLDKGSRSTGGQQTAPHPVEPASDACLSDTPGCRAQFLARAAHFVSREGLGIPGLGRGRLQRLVEAGLVVDLPSLFRFEAVQVARVSGFGVQGARRLVAALRKARRPQSFRLVTALGIPGVGRAATRRLSGEYGSLEELLRAGEYDGDAAARKVRRFFATPGGTELLAGFRELGLL